MHKLRPPAGSEAELNGSFFEFWYNHRGQLVDVILIEGDQETSFDIHSRLNFEQTLLKSGWKPAYTSPTPPKPKKEFVEITMEQILDLKNALKEKGWKGNFSNRDGKSYCKVTIPRDQKWPDYTSIKKFVQQFVLDAFHTSGGGYEHTFRLNPDIELAETARSWS